MSFSAEMKDFLGAWEKGNKILGARTDEEYKKAQTEAVKKKTETEYDPERLKLQDEQARANLAKTQAGTGLIGEQIKNAGTSRGYTAALTDRIKRADQEIGGYQTGNLPMVPAAGPVAPNGQQPVGQPDLQPSYGYAAGGAIPDTDDETAEPPGLSEAAEGEVGPQAGAIPDAPAAPMSGATDFSARRRSQPQEPQVGYNGIISPELVSNAVRGGYKYYAKTTGAGGRGTGARARENAMRLAQGQDALSPQEMDAARKAVDPEGRLTESQRNMVALGSVYQYWANKGDPARADKVAFQMLQHYRLAAQRYAAIAAAAAEHGNMDMATKAALKAYANVPDGRDMQVTVDPNGGGLKYNYTDENGKTISQGIASPQEFASQVMGLTRGGFDQALLSSAAAREGGGRSATRGGGAATSQGTQPAVGGEGKGDKVGDQVTRGKELLDPEIEKQQQAWSKKNSGKEVDDTYWGNLRDGAMHTMQQNPNMTAREALAVTQALTDPKNDKYKTVSEGGKNVIKFADGQKAVLDDDAFDKLINIQAQNRRAQHAAEDQAAIDAKKPSRFSQAVEGAQQAGRGIANVAEDAGRAVSATGEALGGAVSRALPEELKTRGMSAIRKAGEVAGDVADRFRNRGAIPDTYDSPL